MTEHKNNQACDVRSKWHTNTMRGVTLVIFVGWLIKLVVRLRLRERESQQEASLLCLLPFNSVECFGLDGQILIFFAAA